MHNAVQYVEPLFLYVELSWDTVLDDTGKLLESLEICGVSLSDCSLDNCPKAKVINNYLVRTIAGKEFPFSELIQKLSLECHNSSGESNLCHTLKNIESRLVESGSAYISPNGQKFWPDPNSERLQNHHSRYDSKYQIIGGNSLKKSPDSKFHPKVVSMGSCFMNEINKCLEEKSYLFRLPEDNCNTDHSFSANWGTIFTPLSAQRCLQFYLDDRQRPEILWRSTHSGKSYFYDVFREDVTFNSLSDYKHNMVQHKSNAKKVLTECNVFICAFSMIETWLTNDGSDFPLARSPWRVNPLAARPHTMSTDDVKKSVLGIFDLMKRHNPNCKILIGIDPVPLHATHNYESCIIADSIAKAKLVAGITDAIKYVDDPEIVYVPFYERVHYCTKNPWSLDERHINDDALKLVFRELEQLIIG